MDPGQAELGFRSLTLAQDTVGGGSPRAEQGMSNSLPTSWKYSSLGWSIKAGGACRPDLYREGPLSQPLISQLGCPPSPDPCHAVLVSNLFSISQFCVFAPNR